MTKIGLLHSTIRGDEKLLLESAKKRGVEVSLVDIRDQIFNPETFKADFEVALERSVSNTKGMYAARFLESMGVKVVNKFSVASICQDKFFTSLVLRQAGVSTLDFAMVFDFEQALEAVESLGGFPVVVKPALGSWGRLLAKVNDKDSLEALLEHKNVLGSPSHKAFYLQEYVKKPDRDIRAFVIGGKVVCAVYRESEHWITNTARGGKALNCSVSKELGLLCQSASEALGGGVLAMDVFETDGGLKINEVNHTMEFKNSEEPTGVSISGEIIDYCLEVKNG
jgi:[lysine-biosynthesis-protein LysW]---L-2-aminoadipate ligase